MIIVCGSVSKFSTDAVSQFPFCEAVLVGVIPMARRRDAFYVISTADYLFASTDGKSRKLIG